MSTGQYVDLPSLSGTGGGGGGGSSGTVTSVAVADGSTVPIYTVSGSPVTTSGTITETLKTQTANTVFAGPTSGGVAQPTFRALVTADLPAGVGTVTSVAFADGSNTPIYTISGSPITGSGTITETLATQAKNLVFAGPASGSNAQPTFRAIATADLPANNAIFSLGCNLDGGGATLVVGQKAYLYAPYACTITAVTMLADQSGSAVVDIWKVAYASYPPTISNTITASALPTISSAQKSQDTTLTGWTTSVSAGDTVIFNVNSCTSITKLNVSLTVSKT